MANSADRIKDIRIGNIFRWFLIFFLLDPLVAGIMLTVMLGMEKFFLLAKILGILAPPILAAIAVYVYLMSRRGSKLVQALASGDDTPGPGAEKFFSTYSFRIALLFFIGNSGGPLLVCIMGLSSGIISSWQSGLYFFVTMIFSTVIFTFLLYYISKRELFPLKLRIAYQPLTIFMKISVPIIALMMALLLILNLTIYNLIISSNLDSNSRHLKKYLSIAAENSTGYFRNTAAEIEKAIEVNRLDSIDINAIGPVLDGLKKSGEQYVENFFAGTPDGSIITNEGKRLSIGDREYFIRLKTEKRTVYSQMIKSRATGASSEQKEGIDQVSLAISDLDSMTQQNASLVEEIASSSEEMSGQAMDLKEMISRFKI